MPLVRVSNGGSTPEFVNGSRVYPPSGTGIKTLNIPMTTSGHVLLGIAAGPSGEFKLGTLSASHVTGATLVQGKCVLASSISSTGYANVALLELDNVINGSTIVVNCTNIMNVSGLGTGVFYKFEIQL